MHFVQAKGILSQNNGMNIYRGCSHGCIYCDSRSKCYGFTHAFEDIEVKGNAPELLEQALRSKRHRCMIGTGAMCDPYLPAEKELRLTRKCLELIDQYEYGVTVLTKASLVLRDLDLLQSINQKAKAVVQMTFTTYDEDLCRKIEPNVSTTRERFEVLMKCKELGIPTLVWMTPILPFINDTRENIEGLLDYCLQADVKGILLFDVGVIIIMYLFEDAAKQRRHMLFGGCDEDIRNQYSTICEEFDKRGIDIFCKEIRDKIKKEYLSELE